MKNLKRIGIVLLVVALALATVATISTFTTEATTAPITDTVDTAEQANIDALQSTNAQDRAEAAQALAGSDSDLALTALLGNLADGDPAAGYFTAIALAASENPNVMANLVAELNNPDEVVRHRAALALSHMDGEIAVDALAPALEDGATAAPVAEILVNMDDEKAHELVLTALADEELTTRRHAVMGAIESADPVVQNFILGRALGSDNLILRNNAMELRDFIGESGAATMVVS